MGKALYRKFRSTTLSEVIGQEHITETLAESLRTNRLSHAYLFTGPRGVGKTSVARIFAHQVNGLNYEQEANHIDIIEIDAASNRGIDEIRDLREKVHISPVLGKFKVYIIDEVHMLTSQAFNALLKTLEEPPQHVIFILATTESHKIPATIISRTQRYIFKPIEKSKVVAHLKHIAETENIAVDKPALEMFAIYGEGSFRDSIGLLDQASRLQTQITAETARQLLGLPSPDAMEKLISVSNIKDIPQLIRLLQNLVESGITPEQIAKSLSQSIRHKILANPLNSSNNSLIKLIGDLIEVPASIDPYSKLEIILMQNMPDNPSAEQAPEKQINRELPDNNTKVDQTPLAKEDNIIIAERAPISTEHTLPRQPTANLKGSRVPPVKLKVAQLTTASKAELNDSNLLGFSESETLWTDILHELKKQYNTLYGVME